MARVAMNRAARLAPKGAMKRVVAVVVVAAAAKVAVMAVAVGVAEVVVVTAQRKANVNVSMPKVNPSWRMRVSASHRHRRMRQARMDLATNRGKSALPAMPNAAGVVSATPAVTVAATNALTTSNRARQLNAVSLGQTDAMSAGLTAIVVQMKMRAMNPPTLTTWQRRSIAWPLPHRRRQLTPTWATALSQGNKKPVLTA